MKFLPFACLIAFVCLDGCVKPVGLPDITVTAASPDEFARFRSDLGTRFTAEQLKDFDTATQELQLDAMNRDVPSAEGREADMLAVANGKTVHAVTVLGWQARKARFLRETAELTKMLDHDLALQAKAGADTSSAVLARIQSEKEVIAGIQRHLAETERRLAEFGTTNPH